MGTKNSNSEIKYHSTVTIFCSHFLTYYSFSAKIKGTTEFKLVVWSTTTLQSLGRMSEKRVHTMADKRGHTHCFDIYMCQESRDFGNRVSEGEYRGEGDAERARDAAE